MELSSGNLRSQCEAVIAVLQGLMSSRGGTSAWGVTGSELAEVCQQSYVRVMGCNMYHVYLKCLPITDHSHPGLVRHWSHPSKGPLHHWDQMCG